MKRALVIWCLALGLTACSDDAVKVPEHVLDHEAMTELLVDIHLMEAAANINKLEGDQSKHYKLYDFIFEKHDLTRADFDSSYAFYTDHPDLFDLIYDDVINELSKMQGENAAK